MGGGLNRIVPVHASMLTRLVFSPVISSSQRLIDRHNAGPNKVMTPPRSSITMSPMPVPPDVEAGPSVPPIASAHDQRRSLDESDDDLKTAEVGVTVIQY